MSRDLGLPRDEADALGEDSAVRVRTFRLIVVLAQRLRTLMDQRLRADGLTTQQAALTTIVDAIGEPTLSQAAAALGTTHQNARQLATALQRKGMLVIEPDPTDGRVKRLRTTMDSREYWQQRSTDDQRYVLEWFAGLSAPEARTLFELLLRLHERVTT